MDVGKRIRSRREALGLSVEDVARKLGKHRATVYRYESDDIKALPTDVLAPLAIALETTPAYLMGWEEAEEDEIDNQLISMLTKLTPVEAAKVEAFVQGLIANRAE